MLNHLMVDIETLSIKPNATIIQIAAVPFNLDGDMGTGYNVFPSLVEQENRDRDTDTINWWASTEEKRILLASILIKQHKAGVQRIALNLSQLAATHKTDYVWCKGIDFDLPILQDYFNHFAIDDPFEKVGLGFRSRRCARQLNLVAKDLGCVPSAPRDYSLQEHNALDDCKYQIQQVSYAMSYLKGKQNV